jgi:hypothetical protein
MIRNKPQGAKNKVFKPQEEKMSLTQIIIINEHRVSLHINLE